MKVRLGFVANSSSSDYILPGEMYDEDEPDPFNLGQEDDDTATHKKHPIETELRVAKMINATKTAQQQQFPFVNEEFYYED